MPKKRLVQKYSKDANSSPSCLEVHTGFFRLSMKEVFDVYFLSPFWKRFPYYKNLLILGTTWCIHLNCFYNSHLLLQVVHCRKYPTISSYFRVTLPIFGTDNSSTAEREPYHAMTNVSNLALPTSSTSSTIKFF